MRYVGRYATRFCSLTMPVRKTAKQRAIMMKISSIVLGAGVLFTLLPGEVISSDDGAAIGQTKDH